MNDSTPSPRDSDRELAGPGSETLDEYRRRLLGGAEPLADLEAYLGGETLAALDAYPADLENGPSARDVPDEARIVERSVRVAAFDDGTPVSESAWRRRERGSVSPGIVLLLLVVLLGSLPLFASGLSTGVSSGSSFDPSTLPAVPPILVVAWLFSAVLAAMIASAKRRSVAGAAIGGLLFGFLAVGFLAIAPSKAPKAAS